MFSGIVEAQAKLLDFKADHQKYQIKIEKPQTFNDIALGDSISVNGVCLTVEEFDEHFIQFSIGLETLRVTGWNQKKLEILPLNLERSLRMSDRMHGHMVAGHVDGLAMITALRDEGNSRILSLKIGQRELLPLLWQKGSVALNGVSLTINKVSGDDIEVCLIPETLKRTNFSVLNIGDIVTVEADQWARAVHRAIEMEKVGREFHH
jgi:riboflavin synthase